MVVAFCSDEVIDRNLEIVFICTSSVNEQFCWDINKFFRCQLSEIVLVDYGNLLHKEKRV